MRHAYYTLKFKVAVKVRLLVLLRIKAITSLQYRQCALFCVSQLGQSAGKFWSQNLNVLLCIL